MLARLHANQPAQLLIGLLIGVGFGFLLQKGGATSYDVIVGQLLLTDFTVLKLMLSAVVVGMIGVHLLTAAGLAQLHIKPGGWGSTVVGGLIFGVGFGLLGYCPGTAAAAAGHGTMDALIGGIGGILVGSALFALAYPRLARGPLAAGKFAKLTLTEALGLRRTEYAVVVMAAVLIGLLAWLESAGL
ncbi:MAG TPA: YeeE/YedE thiosulfate transporter family protein [Armatimonadota bacterium]|nr:YeeE/YedE thiosulfate transporter family protein [Armatimonadota bacterium]HQK92085.1 YeeE/YedE thiosulfate transporter family protein [Armatimonadota bacterium]